jgi:hypothetical protein
MRRPEMNGRPRIQWWRGGAGLLFLAAVLVLGVFGRSFQSTSVLLREPVDRAIFAAVAADAVAEKDAQCTPMMSQIRGWSRDLSRVQEVSPERWLRPDGQPMPGPGSSSRWGMGPWAWFAAEVLVRQDAAAVGPPRRVFRPTCVMLTAPHNDRPAHTTQITLFETALKTFRPTANCRQIRRISYVLPHRAATFCDETAAPGQVGQVSADPVRAGRIRHGEVKAVILNIA